MYGIYGYIENVYPLCGPWASGGCVFIFWFWQCGQNIVYANNAGEGTAHSHAEQLGMEYLEMSKNNLGS